MVDTATGKESSRDPFWGASFLDARTFSFTDFCGRIPNEVRPTRPPARDASGSSVASLMMAGGGAADL